MDLENNIAAVSKKAIWAGRVMSWLPAALLLFGGVMDLFKPEAVVKGTVELGYQESVVVPLGFVLLTCTVLYIIPRTAILGAILLTGYLGGAVSTHVRAQTGALSMAIPVIVGAVLWCGLVLRDGRLRMLVPLRRYRGDGV